MNAVTAAAESKMQANAVSHNARNRQMCEYEPLDCKQWCIAASSVLTYDNNLVHS